MHLLSLLWNEHRKSVGFLNIVQCIELTWGQTQAAANQYLKLKEIYTLGCFSAQQFGEQMQQSNPELFDQLRGQAQAAVNQHRDQNQPREGQDPQPG